MGDFDVAHKEKRNFSSVSNPDGLVHLGSIKYFYLQFIPWSNQKTFRLPKAWCCRDDCDEQYYFNYFHVWSHRCQTSNRCSDKLGSMRPPFPAVRSPRLR